MIPAGGTDPLDTLFSIAAIIIGAGIIMVLAGAPSKRGAGGLTTAESKGIYAVRLCCEAAYSRSQLRRKAFIASSRLASSPCVGSSRRAGLLPFRISVSSYWRSSPLNRTTYVFTEISFPAMIASIAKSGDGSESTNPFKSVETAD
jgi:hypothetical protein